MAPTMEVCLARASPFSPDSDESVFQEFPAAPAVFLLRGDGEPYVSKTANFGAGTQRLLGRPLENSKRLNLRARVREIEFTSTGSDFESQVVSDSFFARIFPRLMLRACGCVARR